MFMMMVMMIRWMCCFLLLGMSASWKQRSSRSGWMRSGVVHMSSSVLDDLYRDPEVRTSLWKEVSRLERQAIRILSLTTKADKKSKREAIRMLTQSSLLKLSDPFLSRINDFYHETRNGTDKKVISDAFDKLVDELCRVDVPPHVHELANENLANAADNAQFAHIEKPSAPMSFAVDTDSECTTQSVNVKIGTRLMDSQFDADSSRFVFSYDVHITNQGTEPIQLLSRCWRVHSRDGPIDEFHDVKVLQQQPVLPGNDMLVYTSLCPIWLKNTSQTQQALQRLVEDVRLGNVTWNATVSEESQSLPSVESHLSDILSVSTTEAQPADRWLVLATLSGHFNVATGNGGEKIVEAQIAPVALRISARELAEMVRKELFK